MARCMSPKWVKERVRRLLPILPLLILADKSCLDTTLSLSLPVQNIDFTTFHLLICLHYPHTLLWTQASILCFPAILHNALHPPFLECHSPLCPAHLSRLNSNTLSSEKVCLISSLLNPHDYANVDTHTYKYPLYLNHHIILSSKL